MTKDDLIKNIVYDLYSNDLIDWSAEDDVFDVIKDTLQWYVIVKGDVIDS